jgi:hypothetical protein
MNRFLLLFVLLITLATASYSQTATALPPNIRATNTLDRLLDFDGINNYDILYGIPMDHRRELVGDTYLDAEWRKSTVLLNNDKLLEGYLTRYDIKARQLEIKSSWGVKVLNAAAVKSFLSIDSVTKTPHYFINSSRFKDEDGSFSEGFFEVLSDGKIPLLKKTTIEIKRGNYRPELAVGTKEDQILKKAKYFYLQDQRAIPIPPAKKLPAVFGARADELKEFMKRNNISLKEELHLKTLFDHYNKDEKP